MTVQTQSSGKNVEHDQEKSAMAAAQEPSVEELVLGVQVPPRPPIDVERILSTSSMTEWWDLLRASFGTELSQLHWDILSFCKAYELTDRQMQLRRDALDCVKRAVRDIWPSADVKLFGSTAIGLALPWSDIDVVIVPPKQQNLTFRKPTPMAWQSALSLKLNQLGQCLSLRSLPFAKVPILKVVFKSGIACDISFDAWGSEASVLVIRQFMRQHKHCRPLCLVLKFFLGQNNLNELHTGGLGSFCIFTMVISHLQKMASFSAAGCDLGTLLLSFFARYSNMHNYCTDVVSTRADSRSSKLEKSWVNLKHPQLLAVEDPLDPTSDIAKGSHKIEEVRKKFAHAQRVLLTHWYDEHVLAEIVDMTANPNQRPPACSPKKAKMSKKRRAVARQDDHILPYQPALKIQRIHHPPQGSGVVTKRQLDGIFAKDKAPQCTSLPTSKRLRTGGHDGLEEDRSVQNIAPNTPSPIRTVHSKPAKDGSMDVLVKKRSGTVMNNSVPRLCKLFTSDDPKMAAKQPSTQDDDAKSAVDLDFWEAQLTTRRKSKSGSSIHQNRKDVGQNIEPAEAIHLDFGEAQLATRQKSRSGSLIHQSTDVGKNVQPAETIHLDFWEAQLATRRKSRSGSSIHQNRKDVGQNVEPAEAILLHFGETQLATRQKSRSGSLIHQSTKDVGKNVQPAEAINLGFWEAQLTTRRKSRSGSLTHQNTKDLGNNVQPTEAIHSEQSTQGQHVVDVIQDNKGIVRDALEPHLTPKRTSRVGSFPEDSLEGQSGHPAGEVQEGISIDFWEAHLAPRLKSQKSAVSNLHNTSGDAVEDPQSSSMDVVSVEGNGGAPPRQSSDLDQPEDTGKNVTGRSGDEKLLVDFWEELFSPKLKARGCLSKHLAAGCEEDAQPVEKDHPEQRQPPRSIEERVIPEERKLVDSWETQLIPKPKSRMGCLNTNQQAEEEHAEERIDAVGINGEGFERVLVDFWEAHLTPTLKSSRRGSLQHDAIAGEEDNQPIQKTVGSNGEGFDKVLVDFWETHLTPTLKSSRRGSLQHDAIDGEEDNQPMQKTLSTQGRSS